MIQKLIKTRNWLHLPALGFGQASASAAARKKRIHGLRIKACLAASCLITAVGIQPISAELPMLDQPWLGYYAVYANKSYEFKITAPDGNITLIPLSEGAPVSENLLVSINAGIEETLPDGKIVSSPIRPDTLESADPASDKLAQCVIRGKTAGDASLEITIEQSHGIVFVGSRVLDPGTLTNPIRCFVTVVFPNIYPPAAAASTEEGVDERDAKRAAKKEAKAAEDRLKGDSIDLKWTDGKRQKLTFEKVVDAGSKEINGAGIAAAEVKIAAYGKRKFLFNASPNSAIKLSNAAPASLSQGFSIQWFPDPDKNKDGKARLAIEVK
jgi:hypothetical protein